MANKESALVRNLQPKVLSLARVHFFLAGAFALATVIYDAWDLIAPELVLQRWTMTAVLLVVTTTVWYASRTRFKSSLYYTALVFALVAADIALATFMVYTERGMASRGVALYAIPIITSAALASRTAIYAAAALSTAAYSLFAVRYFVVNFNEGYKIELYGVIAFYSAIFFVTAVLLWVVLSGGRKKP